MEKGYHANQQPLHWPSKNMAFVKTLALAFNTFFVSKVFFVEKRVLKQKHWFRSKHGLSLKLKHMRKAGFSGKVMWSKVLGKGCLFLERLCV